MLEISFHRNDLVKTGPLKWAVHLEKFYIILTEVGELIIYSTDCSTKPKFTQLFSKSFPKAIDMCAFKNDFVIILQQSNPHITIFQLSKNKILLETNSATERPTRIYNCKSNICIVDENNTVFVYNFVSRQLNNFLTEGIHKNIRVDADRS